MKHSGTISRGIRTPIITLGDDLKQIVCDSIVNAVNESNLTINDRDVVCITEAVVGISQGNFATADQIAADVQNKFGKDATVGLIFPILSRNRFSMLLRGISRGLKKIIIQLSFPADEKGNKLVGDEEFFNSDINPYSDVFTEAEFRKIFPNTVHEFTGVDYIQYYKEICECECEIILANDPRKILQHTDNVIVASIHTRQQNKKILERSGAKKVVCLDEILCESVNGSGYNEKYGLLGSNLLDDNGVKLFPRNCQELVDAVQKQLFDIFGKKVEVMVYGDGAFKDPQGGIWELADPVVSPGFTKGLIGTPNELKLKYLTTKDLNDLKGDELEAEVTRRIKTKDACLVGKMETQGTTPRQLTDLLGSLADLTSGSGDKGTPVILIQNYFENWADR